MTGRNRGFVEAHPRTLDLRLVGPALACWAAAGVLVGVPEVLPVAVAVLWLGAAGLLALALVGNKRRWRTVWGTVAVCCAAAGLTASVIAAAVPSRYPPAVGAAVNSHADVLATVTVLSVPVEAQSFGGASTRIRFSGTITSLTATGTTQTLSVPVIVYAAVPRSPTSLPIGSSVELRGDLGKSLPGEAAAVRLFGREAPELVAGPPWWLAWAGELRERFSRSASELPGDGAALLPGLAIGDTRAVSVDLDAAMKASSLSHLTAVSGANCVLVIACIMLLGAAIGLRRGVRVTLSLVALAGFVVLVTPEASVLRASVMAVIVMISMASGRPSRGLPALTLAVILLLLVDPWLSRDYGFALSALATAGLLVLSAPLARALSRWMPGSLAVAVAVPLAAQLACQPVLVLLTPSLPLYGVPANLLAAPAAPVATFAGLLACLLLPVLPGVAGAILHVAWVPSAWIAAVATATADFPGSRLPWWGGFAGAVLIALLTVLTLVSALRGDRLSGRRWRPAVVAVLVVFCGAYSGVLIGTGVGRALTFPADWQIAACDIGQGDAVVVRDGGLHALVDTGRHPALLTQCLRTLGIEHIDLLVLTHYDADHVGGIDAVVGMVDVALVGVPDDPEDERLLARVAAAGAEIHPAGKGDSGILGGLSWRVLWPVRGSTVMNTGNDGSVTIEFHGRGIRSLFLADLGEESQRAMLAAARPGHVDLVKVAHHGSGDQSPELYAGLSAAIGLITVGTDNGYGHPTKRVLDILRSSGTLPLRTDQQGMLIVAPGASGSRALTVWTERPG
ncbi:MAG TPA: ComEC/Rec2 family competence protein [Glaciibacter sp.]|nr:ComEC/Rec2 family competence protein [Glaciibacter sp.]